MGRLNMDEFDAVFELILLLIKLDIKSAQDELDDIHAITSFLDRMSNYE
jgi:hypothetical protein